MSFKGLFLSASAVILAVIVLFIAMSVRRVAQQTDASTRVARAQSKCASQVDSAINLVKKSAGEKGFECRVTETANHYNQQLGKCLVSITTYENRDSNVLVKTLISTSDQLALLWSLRGSLPTSERSCFGENSLPLNCAETDRRWEAFMSE